MRVNTRVVMDWDGNVLERESYDYDGPVAECKGGGGGDVNSVDYEYNDRMASLSEEQQVWAREYFGLWQQHFKPYEVAQAQSNLANLPLENNLYRNQLQAANELLPQQTAASKAFLSQATKGVDVNERMALATADTSSAWKNVGDATARENARMGVNPNSGRFQGVQAALGTQQAAQLAGARTQARVGAEQENFDRLTKAATFNPSGSLLQGLGFMKG